jgi:hypothetical protein
VVDNGTPHGRVLGSDTPRDLPMTFGVDAVAAQTADDELVAFLANSIA